MDAKFSQPGARRSILKSRQFTSVDPWSAQPGWTTFYNLGVLVSREMPANKTYAEIGAALGITKQNAYTEAMIALGKVVFALRRFRDVA